MFSIIVPTYNRCDLLPKCIDYIIAQNYPADEFEILIIDNNSNDKTPEIAQKIISTHQSHEIRYYKETKQGLVYARHRGAKESKGDILIFTDDDGFWVKKDNLKIIKESFDQYPEIEGVSGKINIQWDNSPDEWIAPYECLLGKIDLGPDPFIMSEVQMNGAHYVIKKETLYRTEGFHPDQIFQHLIGDGESGLSRKLTKKNIPILWQPNSVVNHYQLKSRNGTYEDISRRFSNNGSAKAYELIVENKCTGQLTAFISSGKNLLLNMTKIIIKKLVNRQTLSNRFQMNYDFAIISYLFKYRLQSSFREKVLNKDWKLKQFS